MTTEMRFNPPPSSYQDVPYPNDPYRSSHPDHLATVAILSGMTPPAVARSRVLELGCARGGNLIPMASSLPGAQFLGVDSSPRQVGEACELIDKLGLTNIRVEERDILDLGREIGTFDFIICHGTFSWVERDVQDKILEICSSNLAPDGLAYISYNTYPGWHFRGLVREMMCFHTRQTEDPSDRARLARSLLQFMVSSTQGIEPAYSAILKQELDYVTDRSDSYLLHDHLEAVNDPIYFYEFAPAARSRGLFFLSEVQSSLIAAESLPREIVDELREFSESDLEFEQFMDFLLNRRFRQSVLCRRKLEVRREPHADTFDRLYVAARPTKDHTATASHDDSLLKAALDHLHRVWPLSLTFESLLQVAGADTAEGALKLMTGLLRCYSQKRVELNTLPPLFVTELSDRPVATRLARVQSQTSSVVSNLRHEAGQLNEFGREVISILDGNHDHAAIVARLIQASEQGRITLTTKGTERCCRFKSVTREHSKRRPGIRSMTVSRSLRASRS